MEEEGEKNNDKEKQNLEEEEFDEEDEEEKESDKPIKEKYNKKIEEKKENNEIKEVISGKKENEIINKEKKQQNIDIIDKKEIISDNKEEKEEKINIQNNEKEKEDKKDIEKEEELEEIKEGASSYILKYTRKNNEPRESAYDKELIKAKNCFFMIEFKILKSKKDTYLLIYCHEIAAIYFDEIYEKKFSLKDLYKENRHFRIFDDIEETKNIIDEILNNNTSNSKKIFIDLQENTFRLHLKMVFFDKETEIIFNIPKKKIDDI